MDVWMDVWMNKCGWKYSLNIVKCSQGASSHTLTMLSVIPITPHYGKHSFMFFQWKYVSPACLQTLPKWEKKHPLPVLLAPRSKTENVCPEAPVIFTLNCDTPNSGCLCCHLYPCMPTLQLPFFPSLSGSGSQMKLFKVKAKHANCSVVGSRNEHKSLHLLSTSDPMKTQWNSFIFNRNVPNTK